MERSWGVKRSVPFALEAGAFLGAAAALAPAFFVAALGALVLLAAVALPLTGDFFVILALVFAAGFVTSGEAFWRVDLRVVDIISLVGSASSVVFLMYLTPAMYVSQMDVLSFEEWKGWVGNAWKLVEKSASVRF